jgi:hypothetical protein
VFDDPAAGLDKEPFVEGMPEIIQHCLTDEGILRRAVNNGFTLRFSDRDFIPEPGEIVQFFKLTRLREEDGGNWYRLAGTNLEGWLCPALFAYFQTAPDNLYFTVTP